jgi:hypothetical protein
MIVDAVPVPSLAAARAVCPSNTRAQLIQGPGSTDLIWLEGAMRFDLMGPPDTLSPEDAIEAANAL